MLASSGRVATSIFTSIAVTSLAMPGSLPGRVSGVSDVPRHQLSTMCREKTRPAEAQITTGNTPGSVVGGKGGDGSGRSGGREGAAGGKERRAGEARLEG